MTHVTSEMSGWMDTKEAYNEEVYTMKSLTVASLHVGKN